MEFKNIWNMKYLNILFKQGNVQSEELNSKLKSNIQIYCDLNKLIHYFTVNKNGQKTKNKHKKGNKYSVSFILLLPQWCV